MFVIDRYAYNNRWTAVPVVHKFILYVLLMVISFSGFLPLQILLMVAMVPLTCYIAKVPVLKYLGWFRYPSVLNGLPCREPWLFWYFPGFGKTSASDCDENILFFNFNLFFCINCSI